MRFRALIPLALLALALGTFQAPALRAESHEPPALESDDEKMLYTLGMALAQQIGQFGITEDELALIQRGLADAVLGQDTAVELREYGPRLQAFAQERASKTASAEKAESDAYVEKLAAEEGAERTESGLVISELTAGTGASPSATDTVKVHYHGTLRDGTVFDSSVDRGEPVSFALNQVIPCWTEGLQKMKVGGKSRLVCPSEIAYGEQGRPGIPGGAALVFEVELLEIPAADG